MLAVVSAFWCTLFRRVNIFYNLATCGSKRVVSSDEGKHLLIIFCYRYSRSLLQAEVKAHQYEGGRWLLWEKVNEEKVFEKYLENV